MIFCKMIKLDKIDIQILKILQKDVTKPLTEISKKIGISKTPCWNRIKKLEEDKVIIAKTILIDNKKINLPIKVFLSISIQNHTEIWLNKFKKVIQKYDEIIEVHRLTGTNVDYQITILSPSIEEYDLFQQKLINEIECTNMSSHISLQTIKKNNNLSLNYI